MTIERANELLCKCISENGEVTYKSANEGSIEEIEELIDNGIQYDPNNPKHKSLINNMIRRFYFDALDFCGCGKPESSCDYILAMLYLYYKSSSSDCEVLFGDDDVDAMISDYGFGDEQIEFILKWLDSVHLTEHGTGIYGSWLTNYGELIKNILKIRKKYNIII